MVRADGTFFTFVPPLLVAVSVWALIFSWMKLDGFRRGWDLPATLSQLFLALCLLMAVLMAGAYLLRIFLSRLTLSYFGILLFVGFLSIRCARTRDFGFTIRRESCATRSDRWKWTRGPRDGRENRVPS